MDFKEYIKEENDYFSDPRHQQAEGEQRKALETILNSGRVILTGPPYNFIWNVQTPEVDDNGTICRIIASRSINCKDIINEKENNFVVAASYYPRGMPNGIFIDIPILNWIANDVIDQDEHENFPFFVSTSHFVHLDSYFLKYLRPGKSYTRICPHISFQIYNYYLSLGNLDRNIKCIKTLEFAKKVCNKWGQWDTSYDVMISRFKIRHLSNKDITMSDWGRVM
jgi:hypothetical protein